MGEKKMKSAKILKILIHEVAWMEWNRMYHITQIPVLNSNAVNVLNSNTVNLQILTTVLFSLYLLIRQIL